MMHQIREYIPVLNDSEFVQEHKHPSHPGGRMVWAPGEVKLVHGTAYDGGISRAWWAKNVDEHARPAAEVEEVVEGTAEEPVEGGELTVESPEGNEAQTETTHEAETAEEPVEEPTVVNEAGGSGEYKCSHCGRICKSEIGLRSHEKRCTAEEVYS